MTLQEKAQVYISGKVGPAGNSAINAIAIMCASFAQQEIAEALKLPATRAALKYMEQCNDGVCSGYDGSGDTWGDQSDEMKAFIAAAIAEIGGAE